MSVRVSLRIPRLIQQVLKLTIMEVSSGHEVYETRIDNF